MKIQRTKAPCYLTELDFSREKTEDVLQLAGELKQERLRRERRNVFNGESIALYFEKPSVRTRVSFTVGVQELGGQVVELSASTTKVGKGEDAADFGMVLGCYVSMIVARVFAQSSLVEIADHAGVPVVNALSDDHHPCQALADALTLVERFQNLDGLKFAFIGEGNNVATSTGLLLALLGADVRIASPDGYGVSPEVLQKTDPMAGKMTQLVDPREAVRGASVVYTDTWVSMGDEAEAQQRRQIFKNYTVDEGLMAEAEKDAVVMHCLPAVRGDEIAASLMYSNKSAIWDQAENRLHAQKALLLSLFRMSRNI